MNGILLNDDFSLRVQLLRDGQGKIVSGLMTGDINPQRVRFIALAQKGELKEQPLLGFGIENYLKSPVQSVRQKFINELEKELAIDRMQAKVTVGDQLATFKVDIQ